MTERRIGYIRVSSVEQNIDRQIIAIRDAGVPPENIYTDRQSGKDFDRPAWHRMVGELREGDILYVKSIDRLGRNYGEIQEQWRILTKEMHVDVCVIDMPLLDTRRDRDLTGTLISDIVLQLLSYVAESERNMIRQRQEEGIAAAKSRGVRFGRPRRELGQCFFDALSEWREGRATYRQAANMCGMTRDNFRYYANREHAEI